MIVTVSVSAVVVARAMTNAPPSTPEEDIATDMQNFESKSAEEPRMIITDADMNSLPDSN